MSKSEKMVEAGKKAWTTRRANEVSEKRNSAGRKAAITKLKKKVSNTILSASSVVDAEQGVKTILENSPQMK